MASATNNQPISSIENPLVVFNITAQINEKLTPSTFSQWRAQFEALLIGYDLMDYVNGDSILPYIAAPIRAREKSLASEELHDLLVGHKSYLCHMEAVAKQLVLANFTSKNPSFHGSNWGRAAQRSNAPSRSQGPSRTGNGQQRDQRRQNNASSRNN
ncbi:hypothetical protein Pint_30804 [Pistacia integerrima]|uniref:Uncharacterized protein n=1 Tax=Pistacia integerrima TaxID=434235 RepID=A0ACC0X230_9ROSI|nr:hypothetical protein Pint_30804 [Pistacia integerrima]